MEFTVSLGENGLPYILTATNHQSTQEANSSKDLTVASRSPASEDIKKVLI